MLNLEAVWSEYDVLLAYLKNMTKVIENPRDVDWKLCNGHSSSKDYAIPCWKKALYLRERLDELCSSRVIENVAYDVLLPVKYEHSCVNLQVLTSYITDTSRKCQDNT